MAPLTWREVAAPNFSGVAESQRVGATLLNNGFQSAIDAIGGFGKDQADRAAAALEADKTRALTQGYNLDNVNQGLVNDQLGFTNDKTRQYEAARPAAVDLVNQIRYFDQLGTEEGRAKAADLMRSGSATFASAGWTPDQVNSQINGNLATNTAGLAVNQAHQASNDANVVRANTLEAQKLVADVIKKAPSLAEAENAIRGMDNVSPEVATLALGSLQSNGPALFGGNVDQNSLIVDQSLQKASADTSALAPLKGLILQTEAGGYDTLHGNAERGNGPLAGVQVSKQTIGQLKQFSAADGAYGQAQKDKLGYLATPMGQYSIVGSTLAATAKEMGLSDGTVFTPEVQDAMFQHLVDKRLSGPQSIEGKMSSLRQEWAGFKSVPDNVLSQAITAYQTGDKSALTGIASGNQGNPDMSLSPAVNPANAAIQKAVQTTQGLVANDFQSVVSRSNELGNQAQTILNSATANGITGNPVLLAKLTADPTNKSELDASKELMAKLNANSETTTLFNNPNDIMGELNRVKSKYGLSTDMAQAFLEESINQNGWGTRWLFGQTDVDTKALDQLVAQYINVNGKTPAERLAPAVAQLTADQSRKSDSATLQTLQTQLATAQQELANAESRAKTRSGVSADPARRKVEKVQEMLAAAIKKADQNPFLRQPPGQ